jgi:CsoR family transcriptional regulator, copper-sensing transcriptional repressor
MARRHKTTHEEQLTRLARIEGQVRGIRRMIEEGAYCVDILTQVQAAEAALRAVGRNILHKHMQHCVADAFRNPSEEDAEAKINELMDVMKRSC